jgi:hypothetical protein
MSRWDWRNPEVRTNWRPERAPEQVARREGITARRTGGERGLPEINDYPDGRIVSNDPRAQDYMPTPGVAAIAPKWLPPRVRVFLDSQTRNRLPNEHDIL